jgi:hypothetical protein
MKELTNKEIEAELKELTEKHVLLAGLFGLLVGILQEEVKYARLRPRLSLLVEEAKVLSPTVPTTEWDELMRLVTSFAKTVGAAVPELPS